MIEKVKRVDKYPLIREHLGPVCGGNDPLGEINVCVFIEVNLSHQVMRLSVLAGGPAIDGLSQFLQGYHSIKILVYFSEDVGLEGGVLLSETFVDY